MQRPRRQHCKSSRGGTWQRAPTSGHPPTVACAPNHVTCHNNSTSPDNATPPAATLRIIPWGHVATCPHIGTPADGGMSPHHATCHNNATSPDNATSPGGDIANHPVGARCNVPPHRDTRRRWHVPPTTRRATTMRRPQMVPNVGPRDVPRQCNVPRRCNVARRWRMPPPSCHIPQKCNVARRQHCELSRRGTLQRAPTSEHPPTVPNAPYHATCHHNATRPDNATSPGGTMYPNHVTCHNNATSPDNATSPGGNIANYPVGARRNGARGNVPLRVTRIDNGTSPNGTQCRTTPRAHTSERPPAVATIGIIPSGHVATCPDVGTSAHGAKCPAPRDVPRQCDVPRRYHVPKPRDVFHNATSTYPNHVPTMQRPPAVATIRIMP
jgi:hypothetical protein